MPGLQQKQNSSKDSSSIESGKGGRGTKCDNAIKAVEYTSIGGQKGTTGILQAALCSPFPNFFQLCKCDMILIQDAMSRILCATFYTKLKRK